MTKVREDRFAYWSIQHGENPLFFFLPSFEKLLKGARAVRVIVLAVLAAAASEKEEVKDGDGGWLAGWHDQVKEEEETVR